MNSLRFLFLFSAVFGAAWSQDMMGLEDSAEHAVYRLRLEDSRDPDVERALRANLLNPGSTGHSTATFTDAADAKWTLQVFQNLGKPQGPTFFVPHDSENEAFLAGARAVQIHGGHLLAFECGESRTCDKGIDPNRHFKLEHPVYVSTIMRFYEAKPWPVITLHNNHDSHYLLGGAGAIYADLAAPYTDGVGFYNGGDPDDLVIYSDTASMDDSSIFAFYQREFDRLGLNSIFEFVRTDGDLGGHMSTYVLINTNREYFNVEAEHGHEAVQSRYLNQLLDILGVAL